MKEKLNPRNKLDCNPTKELPPGWPANVSLPTREEAEAAVRKVGEMIAESREARKNKRSSTEDEPLVDDSKQVVVTI